MLPATDIVPEIPMVVTASVLVMVVGMQRRSNASIFVSCEIPLRVPWANNLCVKFVGTLPVMSVLSIGSLCVCVVDSGLCVCVCICTIDCERIHTYVYVDTVNMCVCVCMCIRTYMDSSSIHHCSVH